MKGIITLLGLGNPGSYQDISFGTIGRPADAVTRYPGSRPALVFISQVRVDDTSGASADAGSKKGKVVIQKAHQRLCSHCCSIMLNRQT
jgi:hypothetical protein